MKKRTRELLLKAKALGLDNHDSNLIESLIENGEFRVGIEWLIDQLYEFEIQIGNEFFEQVYSIASELKIQIDKIELLKSLIATS